MPLGSPWVTPGPVLVDLWPDVIVYMIMSWLVYTQSHAKYDNPISVIAKVKGSDAWKQLSYSIQAQKLLFCSIKMLFITMFLPSNILPYHVTGRSRDRLGVWIELRHCKAVRTQNRPLTFSHLGRIGRDSFYRATGGDHVQFWNPLIYRLSPIEMGDNQHRTFSGLRPGG